MSDSTTPETKVSSLAAALARSGCLAALAVVPVFFNIYTVRIFEEDKVLLLRSIALVVAGALLIRIGELGRGGLVVAGRSFWRAPLVKPVLALIAAYSIATLTSVDPRVSFWGDYIRAQGVYAYLSYAVIFFALVLIVRGRDDIYQVVDVVLLASTAPAVYAVLQHFGHDPVVWEAEQIRSHGTAGNPIFLAAYLIMTLPLTLARLLAEVAGRSSPERSRSVASVLLICALAGLLGLQLLAILYTQSRGPFLGLFVGLLYFSILLVLRRRERSVRLGAIGLTVAGALFLLLINMPGSPLAFLRDLPYLNRVSRLLEAGEGTGRVRVLIWEGAARAVVSNPERALFGFGPETMLSVYTPYYPPELGRRESRTRSPDRAHNQVFDSLLSTGVVGLIADLVVFTSLLACGLHHLGIITDPRQRRALLWMVSIGAAVGAVGFCLADRSLRFLGLGLPAGVIAGSVFFLLASGLRRSRASNDGGPRFGSGDELLLIGLLAATVAHFVEIHFGIAVTATRLCFWTCAALIVGAGVQKRSESQPAEDMSPAPRVGDQRVGNQLVGLSFTVGLILVILTFDFYRHGVDLDAHGMALAVTFAAVWILGATLVAGEAGLAVDRSLRLVAYATTSLGIWLLFAATHVAWADHVLTVSRLAPNVVRALAAHQVRAVEFLYAAVLAVVCIGAVVSWLRSDEQPRPAIRGWGRSAAYVSLLALVAFLIVQTNLTRARADVMAKQGELYESRKAWDAARTIYEEALHLVPNEDRYLMSLGRVLVEETKAEGIDETEREVRFAAAISILRRAEEIAPVNADHPRNLARAERAWGAASETPEEREAHYGAAENHYQRAVELSPHNAAMWNEWATLRSQRGDGSGALALLDRSLEVDRLYQTTHWLRANVFLDLQQPEAALAAYQEALAIDAGLLPALSGKALALIRLGRLEEAIDISERAVAVAPDDMISRRNLALLYRQSGRIDLAREQARLALENAADSEKPALESFITELK